MGITVFFLNNIRLILFGFFTAFFSSFGQTFFIALSSADIRSTYSLSHGDFGLLYSSATLTSASLLIWAGRKIDNVDLKLYTTIVCFGLSLACLGMANVNHVFWLFPVIFGLRFMGQGLLGHISSVSMARFFNRNRGKALSLATLGYPLGEAIFPSLTVALIASFGWRQMWAWLGIALLIFLVPLMLWLLKGHKLKKSEFEDTSNLKKDLNSVSWTRARVLRDKRFYILLPSFLASSFIGTGFFFHQVHLTEIKSWNLEVFVGFFVIYAITQMLSAMATGLLVDRYTAKYIMRFYLIPAIVGLSFIAVFDSQWAGAVFMALFGITSGAVGIIHGAIWAETYGVANLGAIKAMCTSLMVLSTALSPPIMGIAFDYGISIENVAIASSVYMCISAILVKLAFPELKGNVIKKV